MSEEKLLKAPEASWAVNEKVLVYQGISPTFGRVTVLSRYMLGKPRYVFAHGVNRAAEIFSIWKAHYRIEQVFKRLKQYLAWGKSRLRGNQGAHANVIIPFLAYFVVVVLQGRLKNVTFEKIIQTMNFWDCFDILDILECMDVEHFHCGFPEKYTIVETSNVEKRVIYRNK